QVADACAESAFAIQRQERTFIGHVVDEERSVPFPFEYAEAHVDDVVCRKLWIERERRLRQWASDRSLESGETHRGVRAEVLVADLRETVADMVPNPGQISDPTLCRPAICLCGGRLVLLHGRQPCPAYDAGNTGTGTVSDRA